MTRLRHLARLNPQVSEYAGLSEDAPVTFVPLEAVWADGRLDVSRRRSLGEVSSGYTRFRAGDVLVPKVTPTFQAARVPVVPFLDTTVGAGSTELHVLRPTSPATDARFLAYVCRSAPFLQGGVAAFQGVAGLQRVPESYIADFEVCVDDIGEQRRIADYLDDYLAREAQVSELNRRQAALEAERVASIFVEIVGAHGAGFPSRMDADPAEWTLPAGWRAPRLSQVLRQLTNGYVGPTRDILVDEGVRYIQGLHIKNGRIDFERRPFYVAEEWHKERPRIHLRAGDVLLVQTGDIGQVAVVPAGFGEASCHALQILRVRPDVVSGPYLGAFLRSPFGYNSLISMATGALHPHLEGSIRAVRVLVPPLDVQNGIVAAVREADVEAEALRQARARRDALLIERSRAVISAAVSGRLDVATARRAA